MASYYVYSGAAGTGTGASWANAFTKLATAMSGKAAGDTFYVAHDHSESTAGLVDISCAGNNTTPTKVVCVNRSGSVPPVSADLRATAQILSTGDNTLQFFGTAHYDGIIFIAGNSTGSPALNITVGDSQAIRFDNCSLRLGSTGAGARINLPATANWYSVFCELNNTTVSFANASQTILVYGSLRWTNTPTAILGTMPTVLFSFGNSDGPRVECIGVDLSPLGSSSTIVGTTGSQPTAATFRFIDCKLNAAVTKATANTAYGARTIDFIRSGAAAVNYAVSSIHYAGTLTEETAVVRTGGANDGTTPIAWKVATTSTCNHALPFVCPPIAIWNDTVGSSVTAAVEGIVAASLPKDDEVWLEVEYLGSGSSPQGSFVHDGKANLLTTAADQTTSSETWGSPASIPPTSLTGLLGWWDAQVTGSLTLAGSTINNVADQSGSGNDMTGLGTTKPTYNATGFNSRPAFVFGGSSAGAALQKASFPMGTGNTLTLFYVGTWLSTGSSSNARVMVYEISNADWNAATKWGVLRNGSSTTQIGMVRNSITTYITCPFDVPHRVIITINSSGVQTFYIDGVAQTSATSAGNFASGGKLGLGGYTGEGTYSAGSFGEFGIATGFTDAATVAQLDNYLAAKWQPPSKFKLSTSFTAQQKGWIYVRVKCAKPSSTFYIDPLVTLT